MVPFFPELQEVLEELRDLRSPNADDPVILQYTDPKANLGTEFGRIRKRSGVEPFSRPFDNMRASRATEIHHFKDEWRESLWIGHSRATAREHYLQMLPQHFTEASKWWTPVDWNDTEKPDLTPNWGMDFEDSKWRTPVDWSGPEKPEITPNRDMDSEKGFLR